MVTQIKSIIFFANLVAKQKAQISTAVLIIVKVSQKEKLIEHKTLYLKLYPIPSAHANIFVPVLWIVQWNDVISTFQSVGMAF